MAEAPRRKRDNRAALTRLLENRIAILDGAMATEIQSFNLGEPEYRGEQFRGHDRPLIGNYDLLSITRPDLIRSIHQEYLDAGADIITTNTFRANVISMSAYGVADQVYEINRSAAWIASRVRNTMEQNDPDWPRFVAGAVSAPEGKAEAYFEQVRGLLLGGVDLLLLETVFDTRHGVAALDAFDQCFRNLGYSVPVIASATITEEGRLLSGETLEQFWNLVAPRGLFGVGINCAVGPRLMAPYLEQLSEIATAFVACYPNAGLPDSARHYLESPEDMACVMEELADKHWLNIAGGCCGTGPDHIRLIRETLGQRAPRRLPQTIG
jgi:5-methyltetrahydrofolate--homocysteine methyltransferase